MDKVSLPFLGEYEVALQDFFGKIVLATLQSLMTGWVTLMTLSRTFSSFLTRLKNITL